MPPFMNGLPCLNQSSNLNARVRVLWAATAMAATALIAALALAGAAPAFAADQLSVTPGPDGIVNGISAPDANGTRYLGGAFRNFDVVNTGHGALTDGTTGAINRSWASVGFQQVSAAVADGSGGLYIGGYGTWWTDDGVALAESVAHINADGSLDTNWNPNVTGTVNALAVSGSTVYLGGAFTTVGGTTRNNAAAVDKATGALKSWNPDVDATVHSLAVAGSTVYIGGDFGAVGGAGGATRSNAAAVDATTGAATGWDPSVTGGSGVVFSLAVSGSTVYLGGLFTTVGATPRNNVAAVDATTGTATSWNPNVDSTVQALAVSGSTVYLGGDFVNVGGTPRNRAAAVGTDGTLNSWNPDIKGGGGPFALAVSGSTVYLAGDFAAVGGEPRYNAAAVGTDGSLKSWSPNPSTYATALLMLGSNVFIGGSFYAAGGTPRRFAAAIGSDGTITSWNPILDAYVNAISVSGSTVVIGGAFNYVNGVRRLYVAAIGTDGTLLPTWYGGTGPGSTPAPTPTPTPDPTPTPTPDPPPTPPPTPTAKPAKPAAAWSSSAKARTVTAVITPVTGVTYALTATSGRVKKTGSCKNVTITQGKKKLARHSCTIKLAKGKWLAAVTPKKGSVSGTVNSKSYSFK